MFEVIYSIIHNLFVAESLKRGLVIQWPFFNISGKLKPTCLVLDAEVVLVKYPVNVLVSIPEHLRNSLNQQETV